MKARDKIASILDKARTDARLTQSDLARRLNRTQSFVWKVENVSRKIGVEEFFWLCHALKIDAHAILAELFPAGYSFRYLYSPEPKPKKNELAFNPTEWAYDADELSGDDEDDVDDGDAWDFGGELRQRVHSNGDGNQPDHNRLRLSPLLSKKPPQKYRNSPARLRKR